MRLRRLAAKALSLAALTVCGTTIYPSPAGGQTDVSAWTSVKDRDETTTKSEIFEEEIRKIRRKSGSRPVRVDVKTDRACEAEDGGYPGTPSAKDRHDAVWHEVYIVSPPGSSSPSTWIRKWTGELTCKSPPIPRQRAAADPFRRRVADLWRQVRVEGRVTPVERTDAEAYFATRPRGSRIGASTARDMIAVRNRGQKPNLW